MIDAQFDDPGTTSKGVGPSRSTPVLRGRGHVAPGDRPTRPRVGRPRRAGRPRRDGRHPRIWVPGYPDGALHGVLSVASRGTPVPESASTGSSPSAAASSWPSPTGRPTRSSSTGQRPRSAAGSPASCTTGSPTSLPSSRARPRLARAPPEDPGRQGLSDAADRALDEARRAITVLSVPSPSPWRAPSPRRRRTSGCASTSPSTSTWPATSTCRGR